MRGPWRRMLGTLLGLGTASLRERTAELDRAFAEEGAAAVLASPGAKTWRCDPIPFLFTEPEFEALTTALAQRASLLELVLADLYGPQTLLSGGVLPPALVYASPRYLRPIRAAPPARHLHLYAADLVRQPDGQWCVLADRTAEPAGLAYVLENRRMMARVLPELFKTVEVSQVRPFFDIWQDSLLRLAPESVGNPGLALLTPGHADPRWFEHVVLARELGCALVEDGDLTVRDGGLWVKTLQGLLAVHVLLRRQEGSSVDPLELSGKSSSGIPGLLTVMRQGAVQVMNGPGAAFAEAPGLATFLPHLSRHLLNQPLALPSVETRWLGDPEALAAMLAHPSAWLIRSALDGAALVERPETLSSAGQQKLLDRVTQKPWAFAATAPPRPSYAPCVGEGDTLDPKSVVLRLFLVFDGTVWRPLQGGLARILSEDDLVSGQLPQQALSKDVWVLQEEGVDIYGPGNLSVPALPIRRTAGDMPSRVADNFFWFGRYLERLENAARLSRAILARLARGALLPRDLPDVATLSACLAEAGIVSQELATAAGTGMLTDLLLRALVRDTGVFARLTGRVRDLADTLRDRLSGEMHATILFDLRRLDESRQAMRPSRFVAGIGPMSDFSSRVLEFAATVAGYAAENMVRGGGRLFLDLGRRIERGQSVAKQLAHALDQPADRIEAGLALALELCDSTLTYRSRYLTVLQAAPVIDLVVADEGNPRGLLYQLTTAHNILAVLGGDDGAPLAAGLDRAIGEARAMVTDLMGAADQASAAATLAPRLRAVAADIASASDAVTRQYFALLPVTRTEGLTQAREEETVGK